MNVVVPNTMNNFDKTGFNFKGPFLSEQRLTEEVQLLSGNKLRLQVKDVEPSCQKKERL